MNEITTNTTFAISDNVISEIKSIVAQSRQQAYAAVNQAMVNAYWQIGKRIVEEEQQGKERADYGKQLLKQLSAALTEEFGKGFSVQNLYYFRQFYLTFPEIFHTACGISSTTWRIIYCHTDNHGCPLTTRRMILSHGQSRMSTDNYYMIEHPLNNNTCQ